MDSHRGWRVEAAVAVVCALAIVVVGAAATYFFVSKSNPVHTDPAAVPSASVVPPAERYSAAVETSRRLARELLVRENLPGLSVAVAKDGEIVWAEGFGFAEIERRTPVTPRTRFRLGSVSKTLTAAAVALLYDRGRIDLDAPVQQYVPGYPRKPWTVTTRQLLGDVAGVHRIRGDDNDQSPRGHCRNVSDALETFAAEPLLFEPGTNYRFSTSGWILLSAVVEGAAEESFRTFMSREVFDALGMKRTVFEGTDQDADSVSAHSPTTTLRPSLGVQAAPLEDYTCFAGAGAFHSTPSDLVRFGSAMLTTSAEAPAVGTPRLLKPETLELFQTPQRLKSGASTGFALGWTVGRIPLGGRTVRIVRHRATLVGGIVSLSLFPEPGLVVAATANISHTAPVDPFALQVAEEFVR